MDFSGTLSTRDFAWAVVRRVVLLIAASLFLPVLLFAGVLLAPFLLRIVPHYKPVVHLIFCLSFLGITARRLRDAGLPSWPAFAIVGVFLGDIRYATSFGLPEGIYQAGGSLFGWPSGYLSGLACCAALSLLPAHGGADASLARPRRIFEWAIAIAAGLGVEKLADWAAIRFFARAYLAVVENIAHAQVILIGLLQPALIVAPCALAIIAFSAWQRAGVPGRSSPLYYIVCGLTAVLAVGTLVVTVEAIQNWLWLAARTKGPHVTVFTATTVAYFQLARMLSALLLPYILALMQDSTSWGGSRHASAQ
jgi:uncharacterized membrane protein YhaH (DUF805 family)